MNNKKFLKIYGLIIIILLLVIFIIPDEFYLKLETKLHKQEITVKENESYTFIEIKKQQEKLLTDNYQYEYLMLDSIGEKTITVSCKGEQKDNTDNGSCTQSEEKTYTKETKKDTILSMNVKYLDLEYIFNAIKDIEPTEITYTKTRELLYKTKILELDTDITIYTDLENITQINISNAYMTYVFKYTSIND